MDQPTNDPDSRSEFENTVSDEEVTSRFARRIDAESFDEWYAEREFAENIRQGRPYFNGPSPVPGPERHAPSNLLQCHRKIAYRQANAPEERAPPEGIFWSGSLFEEEVVVPYLRDVVAGEDTYVRNSMWIDDTVETPDGRELRFKGSTDPVIVDRESEPLLVTEVKTKRSLDGLDEPNRHHRAQVHAYMHGLSEKYDRAVDEAVIVYGGRTSMDVRAFEEPFSAAFFERVLDRAATHTEYRESGTLPPADPEYGWECRFCSFKDRCGQSDRPFADIGYTGFLPLVADYPRERVVEYLDARAEDGAKLTPTLAHEYPEVAEEYAVHDWCCSCCESERAWNEVEWDGDMANPPICPACAERSMLSSLDGPEPDTQK
jgi:CRISPR/Cas system-associated exonuclease Cas4 (RecB family)